jgi:hypothetical protein
MSVPAADWTTWGVLLIAGIVGLIIVVWLEPR